VSAGVRNRDGMAGRSQRKVSGGVCGWTALVSRALGVAEPAGHRPSPPALAAAWACRTRVPDAYPAAQSARPRRLPQSHDVSALVATGHRQSGTPSKGSDAADTSMATVSSLSVCAGHLPSGRWSFRKQRTVNPPLVPARYNFLYSSSRPASGRPPAALGRRRTGSLSDGQGHGPFLH
jgi:hypothetical protein